MNRLLIAALFFCTSLMSVAQLNIDEATVSVQVVTLAQGDDYHALRQTMDSLSTATGIAIDTLNRGWNPTANALTIPSDDSDGMYAGYFYPRRFSGRYLSIEPLEYYSSGSMEGIGPYGIVVDVCTLGDSEYRPTDYLDEFKSLIPDIKVLEGEVYVGCMH